MADGLAERRADWAARLARIAEPGSETCGESLRKTRVPEHVSGCCGVLEMVWVRFSRHPALATRFGDCLEGVAKGMAY